MGGEGWMSGWGRRGNYLLNKRLVGGTPNKNMYTKYYLLTYRYCIATFIHWPISRSFGPQNCSRSCLYA